MNSVPERNQYLRFGIARLIQLGYFEEIRSLVPGWGDIRVGVLGWRFFWGGGLRRTCVGSLM